MAHPLVRVPRARGERRGQASGLQELFAVVICSTLALDAGSYERFLAQSGVLHEAAEMLNGIALSDVQSVEMLRRQIQSLVMAAEVDEIVAGMTKGA